MGRQANLVALVVFKINNTCTRDILTSLLYSGKKYNSAGASLYFFQNITTRSKYHSCIVLFTIKHNTYPPIKTFGGITSIDKNLINMENKKGTVLIRIFIHEIFFEYYLEFLFE